MNKNLQFVAIVFLGVCILSGSWLISQKIPSNNVSPSSEKPYRYELIPANESNIIIFDKETGQYWQKYVAPMEGPTEWEKQESPITTQQ